MLSPSHDVEKGFESVDLLGRSERSDKSSTSESSFSTPAKSYTYRYFLLVTAVAVLASGTMIAAQISTLSSIRGFNIQLLLRMYVMAFCSLFIFTELRLKCCLIPSFDSWIYRGFLYSFIGLIGVEMSKSTLVDGEGISVQSKSLLLAVASYSMFSVGGLYVLMGCLCMKCISERARKNYQRDLDLAVAAQSPTWRKTS